MQLYNKELQDLISLHRVSEKSKADIERCSFKNGLGKVKLGQQEKVEAIDNDPAE